MLSTTDKKEGCRLRPGAYYPGAVGTSLVITDLLYGKA